MYCRGLLPKVLNKYSEDSSDIRHRSNSHREYASRRTWNNVCFFQIWKIDESTVFALAQEMEESRWDYETFFPRLAVIPSSIACWQPVTKPASHSAINFS